jgi:hypothetical protein
MIVTCNRNCQPAPICGFTTLQYALEIDGQSADLDHPPGPKDDAPGPFALRPSPLQHRTPPPAQSFTFSQ